MWLLFTTIFLVSKFWTQPFENLKKWFLSRHLASFSLDRLLSQEHHTKYICTNKILQTDARDAKEPEKLLKTFYNLLMRLGVHLRLQTNTKLVDGPGRGDFPDLPPSAVSTMHSIYSIMPLPNPTPLLFYISMEQYSLFLDIKYYLFPSNRLKAHTKCKEIHVFTSSLLSTIELNATINDGHWGGERVEVFCVWLKKSRGHLCGAEKWPWYHSVNLVPVAIWICG